MTSVKFYECDYSSGQEPVYSVIAARFRGSWIFVRHNDRTTWEIAGGHIEEGESPADAARRELAEETGAKEFELECVGSYSVEKDGQLGFGKLYFAEVHSLGPVPDISEIAGIKISEKLPDNLTYPDIQPELFSKVLMYIENRCRN